MSIFFFKPSLLSKNHDHLLEIKIVICKYTHWEFDKYTVSVFLSFYASLLILWSEFQEPQVRFIYRNIRTNFHKMNSDSITRFWDRLILWLLKWEILSEPNMHVLRRSLRRFIRIWLRLVSRDLRFSRL